MAVNVSDAAEIRHLDILRAEIEAGTVHLSDSNYTPDEDTDVVAGVPDGGQFVEATNTGYSDQSAGSWAPAATDAVNRAFIDSPVFIFTATNALNVNIYGFYILNSAGDYLLGARFDDAPRAFGLTSPVEFQIRFRAREDT